VKASTGVQIRLNGICVDHGETSVLKNINLTINPGELVCVVGLSGCGKSTLLKCMSALVEPTAGDVFIDNVNLTALKESDRHAIRARMGFVFQYAALFDSMSVFENVVFGIRKGPLRDRYASMSRLAIARRVTDLLLDVGLVGIERRMPAELSGGMRRRVGLARALATEPDVILYDEPTSGLDPVTAAAIDHLIVETRERRNVTSVVVTHDMASVKRIADRVVMLYGGRVHFDGSRDAFRESDDPVVRQFTVGDVSGPIQTKMHPGGNRVDA
jgi:phospholipid/cholesterol/gamma-HCH transport system ATP-binding protein